MKFNNILGGAVSVHDHSVLNSTNTHFTGNKAESLYDKNPHCPPGLYVCMIGVNLILQILTRIPVCHTLME